MDIRLIAASAAVKDPPLIDLDSTVLVQLVVFVVTAVVLNKFLFKPFLAMRVQRGEGIEGARAEAARMDDEARAKITDYDVRFAKARLRATEERAKLRLEATAREQEIADTTRKDLEGTTRAAKAQLDKDAKAARAELQPRAQEIARAIAKKVLGREVA